MDTGAIPPALDTPASEERKLATVLFADLVGSTEMGDSQDPERTRFVLDRFYDGMAAEIQRAGGTVEKFIGDAVMAAFGAPAAQEDHAERALRAALAMQRRLTALFGERLALRIGVNTGEIVVGRAREGSSFVTGDAVNVAARLEQAAEPGEILVGERSVSATRGEFEFDAARTVQARGKPDGIPCRRLIGPLVPAGPRGRIGRATPFVARDAELGLLRATYDAVVELRRPHVVTVIGEAGVGKSRLVREFSQGLALREPRPVLHAGRCLSYGQGITYRPLGEILRARFGLLEGDPVETTLERLGPRAILALTLGVDVAGDLNPLAARDRLHDAWVELFQDLVEEEPLLVLVEDLHWAERELLDLLERIVSDTSGSLLLLCTARPELLGTRPGWGGARRMAMTIELEPFSLDDADRFLETLVGTEVPPSLRPVFARAEGNPFFLEELLDTLIDRGWLVPEDGGWTVRGGPLDVPLPDSVRAVLAARIDLLAPSEKAAMQAASVIGRVFWTGPVYEMLPEVQPEFRELEDRGFIRRRRDSSMIGEREYAFKHQLTSDVAYESVPKAMRARFHARFAEWLERVGGGRDEHAPLLAHHYAEAASPEEADLAWGDAQQEHERLVQQAVAWLRRSAELAIGRYELRDALSLLERALVFAADDQRVAILRLVGQAHLFAFSPERFRVAMEQALELRPDPQAAAEIFSELAFYGQGRPYMWGQPPPADVAEHWLGSALALAAPRSSARATALLASALGSPEHGAEVAAEGLAIAEELGEPRLLARALEAQAHVASATLRYDEAARWAERALGYAETAGDPYWHYWYWSAGFFFLRAGRFADADRMVDKCERLADRTTPHDRVHAVALRAILESAIGHWANLAELAGRAEDVADANAETPCQFNWRSLLVCALGLEHLGQHPKARRLVELALSRALVAGPVEREPALMRLALLRGDLDEAERILQAMPLSDTWGLDGPAARLDALVALGDRARAEAEASPFLDRDSYYRAFALRAAGVVREEWALVEAALPVFEAMGLEWQAEQTRMMLEAAGETESGSPT